MDLVEKYLREENTAFLDILNRVGSILYKNKEGDVAQIVRRKANKDFSITVGKGGYFSHTVDFITFKSDMEVIKWLKKNKYEVASGKVKNAVYREK
jgi:hypothetical protein